MHDEQRNREAADHAADNQGVLFREDERPDPERSPHYRGHIVVGNVRYRLAGWIREGQKGRFLKLRLRLPQTPTHGTARLAEDDAEF